MSWRFGSIGEEEEMNLEYNKHFPNDDFTELVACLYYSHYFVLVMLFHIDLFDIDTVIILVSHAAKKNYSS